MTLFQIIYILNCETQEPMGYTSPGSAHIPDDIFVYICEYHHIGYFHQLNLSRQLATYNFREYLRHDEKDTILCE